jgi:peptide/nickel transport system substrate-binding protein
MVKRELNRREFLRASVIVAAGAVTAACGAPATDMPMPDDDEEMAEPTATPQPEPEEEKEAAPPSQYTESAMMTEMVNAGDLPPVDDRLPPSPLVLETVDGIGQYSDMMTLVYPGEKTGNWGLYNHSDALVKWKKDFSTHRAALAESWEWNDDGTEVTVHIRKGIRWSDGEEFVTVDDWMFWYNDMVRNERVQAPSPDSFASQGVLPEMEKVDDYTVKVSWPNPHPLFLKFLSRGFWNLSSHRQFTPAHYMKQFHPDYNDEATDEDIQELLTQMNDYLWIPEYPKFSPWLVKEVTVESEQFERNPYYWKVDPDGKQLPYFDRVERRVVQDGPSMMPIILNGETDHARWTWADPVDFPLLVQGQEDGDYEVMWWPCGDASAAGMIIHYCYEPGTPINDLLWNQQFRQAISHAVNRERIKSIVFLDTAQVKQFSMPAYGAEYDSPRGQEIYEQWSYNWTEYSTETAEALLDEAGVVDVDGDGWRELPNGDPLELIIDVNAESDTETQTMELVTEDWQAVGLNTVMNAIDGTLLNQRVENCESMLRYRGGAASGLLVASSHWVPISDAGWTICGQPIALYYASNGERGMEPPEGSWIWDLWDAYDAAISEVDDEKRTELLLDGYEIHIEHGPTQLGFVGEREVPQIRKNYMRNIPDWGVVCSWHYCNIGTLDPEQWWKEV